MGIATAESRLIGSLGNVEPRFGTLRNPQTKSYGTEAREALRAVGVDLFDWQGEVLEQWLEVDNRDWLTRQTAALVVPRRNGKSHLLAARVLFGMVHLDERRVLYTAHEQASARELFDLMRSLLAHPLLEPLVRKVWLGHGLEEIELTNGARFRFRTRTGHGGRGAESDLLILDEALVIDDASMSALTPLTARAASRGRGQIIYASSAGSLDPESKVLLDLRDRGRELDGAPSSIMAYHEWSAERTDEPSDPATWAGANPSMGTPILAESFLESARGRLSVESFAREHLGVWSESGELPAVDPARWAELVSEDQPERDPDSALWMSFDLAPDRMASRVLGFYRAIDGRLIVSVLDSLDDPAGLDGELFAQRVLGLAESYDPELIGFDRLTGAHVEQVLSAVGWKERLRPMAGAKMANGLGSLMARVKLGTIGHDGHAALAGDLGRAISKPFGDGGVIFSRKSTAAGTIAGAVALAAGIFLASDELTL